MVSAPDQDPAFGELGDEISRFANHTRKLLRASHRYREILEEACIWSEGTATLTEAPQDPASALRAIDKFARSRREHRTALIGAYFAHHTLRSLAEDSRALLTRCQGAPPKRRIEACHEVYGLAELKRRRWVSNLLELSIAAAAPDLAKSDYAAFNVGALTDHEDVDLAIVVSSVDARQALVRGFAEVSKTFVRFASKIQLFLTEQLETPRQGALIEEYEQLLKTPSRNVVSVTQLLNAQFLCGDRNLASSLYERVVRSYYAGQGNPTVHEGFLRSVLAELRHFLDPNATPSMLSPKCEIYVPSKLATAAVRVIHNVGEVLPPKALKLVAEKDPKLAGAYNTLADAFVQNEILRALMFLYVVPTDEFDLTDPSIGEASQEVAHLLGLGESAHRGALERLMGVYADLRARSLRSVSTLSLKIGEHLRRVSTFRNLVERGRALHETEGNVVLRLLEVLESYKGSVFWDEVVELIGHHRRNAKRFGDDFFALDEEERADAARRYVEMMTQDAAALVDFLVCLALIDRGRAGTQRPLPSGPLEGPTGTTFFTQMLEHLRASSTALGRFARRMDTDTEHEALFRLANAYKPHRIAALADLIENESSEQPRAARVVRALRSVIIMVHHRSHAIGRISGRVLGRAPDFLYRLGDNRRLKALASELRNQAAVERIPREQIELFGDSFDVAALRASLTAALEGAPAARDIEFTRAVDTYVRDLFKACFRMVRQRSPMFAEYRPGSGIALYATGGYGRSEAFGGDWDYIAVVDSNNRNKKKFFGKVLQRVSAGMTRRGLLPHNRFTQHFNAYVVSIPELQEYLRDRGEENFIDEAEFLEARFILGDPTVARAFNEQVRDYIMTQGRAAFIRDILHELKDRRSALPLGLNLKLAAGGLREIHLLWLALRAFASLPGPLVPELLPKVAEKLPERKDDLRFLMVANTELRRARDLYRLVVAFDDTMEPEVIVNIAKDLAPLRHAGVREGYDRELEKLLIASMQRIDRVAEQIIKQLDAEP